MDKYVKSLADKMTQIKEQANALKEKMMQLKNEREAIINNPTISEEHKVYRLLKLLEEAKEIIRKKNDLNVEIEEFKNKLDKYDLYRTLYDVQLN